MTIYHYTLPWPVLDVLNNELVKNRADGILLTVDGAEADAHTPLGVATKITTGPSGTTTAFTATIPAGRVRFGAVEAAVFSDENMIAADTALKAANAAEAALATIQHIADTATEISYLYRDGAGDIWVSETPVVTGGGRPRIDSAGDVYVTFD